MVPGKVVKGVNLSDVFKVIRILLFNLILLFLKIFKDSVDVIIDGSFVS